MSFPFFSYELLPAFGFSVSLLHRFTVSFLRLSLTPVELCRFIRLFYGGLARGTTYRPYSGPQRVGAKPFIHCLKKRYAISHFIKVLS